MDHNGPAPLAGLVPDYDEQFELNIKCLGPVDKYKDEGDEH